MREEIILFKTAKLAKEKGFILPLSSDRNYWLRSGSSIQPYSWFTPSNLVDYIDAPTQALLQKWLREAYNIIVLIQVFWIRGGNLGYTMQCNKDVTLIKSKGFFDTYEEALENGLLEALELI